MNANKLKLRKLVSACICFVFAFTLGSCGVSNEPEAVADYIMKCYVQGNYENMKEYSVEGIEDQIKRMAQSLKDALKGSEFTRIESESKYDSERMVPYDVTFKDGGIYGDEMRILLYLVKQDEKWLYTGWGVE